MNPMSHKKKIIVVSIVLAILVTSGATWAWAKIRPTVYFACVNKSSGAIKMVSADTNCKHNETKISWNVMGPKGKQGPPGPVGPVGPEGPAGPGTDRYVNLGDGTILDRHTGLVWLRDANCDAISLRDWNDATAAVAALESGICGLEDGSWTGDWRLPTKTEWMATIAEAKALGCTDLALTDLSGRSCFNAGTQWAVNVQTLGCGYWSSTTPEGSPEVAAYVFLSPGGFGPGDKTNDCFWTWPVRDGQ
jgi:hypothetical protein